MSKVLIIGEPMELLLAQQEGRLSDVRSFYATVTGAELNVAVGITRLGLTARYMTRLGNDPRAQRIRSFMKENNISDDLVITDNNHQTGCMMKGMGAPTEHEIYYYRQETAASFISVEDIDALDLSDIRAVHITGVFPAISDTTEKACRRLIERANEEHITVVFDPNLRGILWTTDKHTLELLNEFAAKADVFLPNLNEAEKLCGIASPNEISEHYLELGAKKVVITMGKKGAFYKSRVESGIVPTFRADEVINTLGAGDAFAAGLLSGICDEIPLGEAVIRANAVGCIQIQNNSDNSGLPTMQQLREYMLDHRFVVEHCNEF